MQIPPGLEEYTHIFFSPHLDDVAFSCGGAIALERRQGGHVLVVSAFTGEADPALPVDAALAPFLAMHQRQKEDETAMERLHADHLWLGYQEAIQRHRRYTSMVGLTSRVLDSDRPLAEALWGDLVRICQSAPRASLYFPLAVANHVDHQILFNLGSRLEAIGERVRYYEDVPYTFVRGLLQIRLKAINASIHANPAPRDLHGHSILRDILRTHHDLLRMQIIHAHITRGQKALLLFYLLYRVLSDVHVRARWQRPPPGRRFCPQLVDITEHVPAKLSATGAYGSQVRVLFGDLESFRRALEGYSAAVLGQEGRYVERYWHPLGRTP